MHATHFWKSEPAISSGRAISPSQPQDIQLITNFEVYDAGVLASLPKMTALRDSGYGLACRIMNQWATSRPHPMVQTVAKRPLETRPYQGLSIIDTEFPTERVRTQAPTATRSGRGKPSLQPYAPVLSFEIRSEQLSSLQVDVPRPILAPKMRHRVGREKDLSWVLEGRFRSCFHQGVRDLVFLTERPVWADFLLAPMFISITLLKSTWAVKPRSSTVDLPFKWK